MQQTIRDIIAEHSYDGMLEITIGELADKIAKALQNESQTLTCVYCGHQYPPGTPASNHEMLTEHIKVCEKHPLRVYNVTLGNLVDAIEVEFGGSLWRRGEKLQQAVDNAKRLVGNNS